MKIQIDTAAKTIKVEGKVKLSALFDQLEKFFPEGEWEDYDIETNTTIVWSNPIVWQTGLYRPWYYENPTYVTKCGTGILTTASDTVTIGGAYTTSDVNMLASGGVVTNCNSTNSLAVNTGSTEYIAPAHIFNIECN